MTDIPEKLDDAKVLEYAFPSDEGFGVHRDKNGNEVEISSIAVAKYEDNQFYLFSCDSKWNVIGDLVFDSIEDAKEDAKEDALRWYAVSEIQWIKKTPNQKLDPTVKTPVELGNEQGTAGQL